MSAYLKTKGISIVDGDKPVMLRGVNLGGWLMMEGYILLAPNRAEHLFKNHFKKALGIKALKDFEHKFRTNFVTEEDFKQIKAMGFNCIRLPFNARLVEKGAYQYDAEGLKILDEAVSWAKKYSIYLVLDLHAAPGCQNHDWHSDSAGKADLWTKKAFQRRTLALWEFLADRYKNEPMIAGYDLMNESVLDDVGLLNRFYHQLIKAIRAVDKNHIIFVEGNKWATNIECLEDFKDDNLALSIHSYEPLSFTFNFVPHLRYPGASNYELIRQHVSQYEKISRQRQLPILVGEFGVNYREGLFGEDVWLEDNLKFFQEFGFHWTYWTYKAVKGSIFPDGVFSYYENPLWVNRMGPLSGWETYPTYWKEQKEDMVESWRTKNFKENTAVAQILKNYAR
ncbi:MAG: glycoside hydrolase family 5 protein [Candidatus Omnitrophica bacterium]|nr:glycoside hydrolase family 5 protein [Candidatus Omnitrophota bacterium]